MTILTGRLELVANEFSTTDMLDECAEVLGPVAHAKGIEFVIRVSPEVPNHVIADQARLSSVLTHLIRNAIQSTHEGEVVVDVALEQMADGREQLHMDVTDTGCGYTAESMRSLFDPFSTERALTPIGTGIGLPTCACVVDAMGGSLTADSEPGSGSVFSVTIPVALAPHRQCLHWAGPEMIDLPVLVVDDNATSRMQISDTLSRRGSRATLAASKQEAIKRYISAIKAGDTFAAILVDSAMPDGSGFELAATLGDMPDFNIPIVMMIQAHNKAAQLAMARQAKASACLVKPIREADLYGTLQSLVAVSLETAADDSLLDTSVSDSAYGDEILLVEDNQILQIVTSRILRKHGFSVSVATNGVEALAMLKDRKFSIILMDIMMPVMDGLAAARMIRDQERADGARIPIVALTAMAVEGDRERCLAAGMDFYVVKPVQPKELLDVIRCFTTGERPVQFDAAS